MILPDLPEPDYFTMQQICERWNCNEERLLQFSQSDMLEIGVILDNSNAYQMVNSFEKVRSKLSGFYALSSVDAVGTYHCGERPIYEYSWPVKEVYLNSNADTTKFHEGKEVGIDNTFKFERGNIFSSDSLVITKLERDRFEAKHNMHMTTIINEDTPTDKPLDLREKATWARMVKILCLELRMDLKNPYVIAETIQQLAAKHGVLSPKKNDTIAKRIKELPED